MAIDFSGVSGAGAAATTATPKAADKNSALDKDAFMKLLVAQLQHQDPLKPMEGTEYVAQLSQFAMVEQSMQQTSKLEILSAQMTGLASNEATSLVGKQVTVRGSSIAFDGLMATGASVTLGAPAQKVQVAIKNEAGQVVRTLDLGSKPGGALAIAWDGKDDHGETAPSGKYTVDVKATGEGGAAITVAQEVAAIVTKVSFEKGYPELVLDNGSTAPISDLVSVAAAPQNQAKEATK